MSPRDTTCPGASSRHIAYAAVLALAVLMLQSALCAGQNAAETPPAAAPNVSIHVDVNKPTGDYRPIWNYFGADEPNYTYAANGAKLLRELGAINPGVHVYFRAHNLLTSGNGQGSLKWGSTNVYSEKPDGTPVYDWTITDKIFDNFKATHVTPFVEIGFMPEALSPHPTPYRHEFSKKVPGDIWTGWSYPPKDYAKWRALIVAWVQHLHQRYGADVDSWMWEVWNEPDIPYFHGSGEEYYELYDITTAAVRQVLPHARVGGPAATGPGENNPFLRNFLEHCAHGINADTGKPRVPLDFISFHPKGSPKIVDGHVRMSLGRQLSATDRGMRIVASFPEYQNIPIILSETDPEGCAACQGPQNAYRNGPLYGASVAEMLSRSAEIARLRGVNLAGALTWAFEFEDQPWFAGFRELATNGVDKPVLNVFRMYGNLGGQRLALNSSGAIDVEKVEQNGVTGEADVNGIATRQGKTVDVLLWNYHDDDLPALATRIELEISGLPAKNIRIVQYRMDHDHSNAYTAWLAMGSPQEPSAAQIATLQNLGALQMLEERNMRNDGTAPLKLETSLPRHAVALYRISW